VQAGQLPTTMPRSGTPTDEAGTPQAEITVSESDAGSYQQGKQILATASATSSGGATAAAPTQVPIDGRVATFGTQAGALFRKNAVYQRRNWCSNVCLLSAPIFFCLLLFTIQILVNRLLLAGEDYEVSHVAADPWEGGIVMPDCPSQRTWGSRVGAVPAAHLGPLHSCSTSSTARVQPSHLAQ
jgi:hypothetical protein